MRAAANSSFRCGDPSRGQDFAGLRLTALQHAHCNAIALPRASQPAWARPGGGPRSRSSTFAGVRGCEPAAAAAASAAAAAAVTAAGNEQQQPLLRPLLIDNYDSYTYNLYQIVSEVYGVSPLVVRNDEVDIAGVLQLLDAGEVSHIILSPGPGAPDVPGDIGVCLDVLRHCTSTPVLGVCLGHQALAVAAGGSVVRAPQPVHGRLSRLRHTGHPLFAGCPSGPSSGMDVVRYHSLVVDAASLPSSLQPIAWTCGSHHAVSLAPVQQQHQHQQHHQQQHQQHQHQHQHHHHEQQADQPEAELLMALAHRSRPHFGVQFHPESIASQFGVQLLLNFRALACAASGQQQAAAAGHASHLDGRGPPGRAFQPWPWPAAAATHAPPHASAQGLWPAAGVQPQQLQLTWRHLPGALAALPGGTQALFEALVTPRPDTFWLDSASAPERSRFSYMGGSGGPLWRRITYRLPAPGGGQDDHHHQQQQQQPALRPGELRISDASGGQQQVLAGQLGIWDYLQGQLYRLALSPPAASAAAAALPFNFWGGFVGYFGYELKAEAGGCAAHTAPTPDAAWAFADRLLVADHAAGDVFVLALHGAGAQAAAAATAWLSETARQVGQLARSSSNSSRFGPGVPIVAAAAALEAPPQSAADGAQHHHHHHQQQQQHGPGAASRSSLLHPLLQQQREEGAPLPAGLALRHSRAEYLANVDACKEALAAGESYELCLTTSLDAAAGSAPQPWAFYTALRSANPAPYAAWLSFGGRDADAVVVACSSPERFLAGGRGGTLEARPIKGTAPRVPGDPAADAASAAALLACEKERAENLMIVDLLRNDLGRVCVPGSVHVPGLVELESYASVHQLVSTVRGLRSPGVGALAAIRAAFPGGSMTGAPKVRSMALLDGLEGGPRGVYSGAAGFLSVNDTFDLNIVIRSAVFHAEHAAASGAGDEEEQAPATAAAAAGGGEERSQQQQQQQQPRMRMSVGAGGAIVVQSDPAAEFGEMLLKAERLVAAAAAATQAAAPPC